MKKYLDTDKGSPVFYIALHHVPFQTLICCRHIGLATGLCQQMHDLSIPDGACLQLLYIFFLPYSTDVRIDWEHPTKTRIIHYFSDDHTCNAHDSAVHHSIISLKCIWSLYRFGPSADDSLSCTLLLSSFSNHIGGKTLRELLTI